MYKSNIALTIMLLVWTLQYLHHSAHSLVLTTKSQSVLSPQMSPTIIETCISTLNMETNHWNKPICTILSLSKYWGFAQLVTGVEDSCSVAICTVLERGIVLTVGDTVWDVAGWGETKAWWNKSVYTVLTSAHSDTSLVHSFAQCIDHHGNFSKVLSSVLSPVANVNRML